MSPLLNKLLIGLGVCILVFGVVYFYTSTKSPTTNTSQNAGVMNSDTLAQTSEKIYTDMNKISTITINESLFTDKRFTSLVDTRVTLGQVGTGRSNPFAPIE
jgi:hypothetical protein